MKLGFALWCVVRCVNIQTISGYATKQESLLCVVDEIYLHVNEPVPGYILNN